MMRLIGNALSLTVVGAALSAVVGATFTRELAPLEGMMLWKAGLLGSALFGFRLPEAAAPATASIVGKTAGE
jgi:hypothetical protein